MQSRYHYRHFTGEKTEARKWSSDSSVTQKYILPCSSSTSQYCLFLMWTDGHRVPKEKSQKWNFGCVKDSAIIFGRAVSLTTVSWLLLREFPRNPWPLLWCSGPTALKLSVILFWTPTPCDKVSPSALGWGLWSIQEASHCNKEQRGQWWSVAWKFSPKPGVQWN